MTGDAELILVAGALLAAGVVASIVADRLRLPALVLFLGVGMAIGTDGLGWIDFEDYERARLIGSAALSLVLFEGGFGAGWSRIRPFLRPAVSLAVIATIGTAAVAGLAAAALFDLSGREGLLVGAIVSGTDGAAVFALLRGTPLPARLARTLEGEAGFNDPVAVLLVLVIIELITKGSYGATDIIVFVGRELLVGVATGLGVGWVAARTLRNVRATPTGIVLVASLASAAVAFGLAGVAHGSGFLAVYLVGLQLADAELPERAALRAFHEGLAAVAEIVLFLALGLLVFPSQLDNVALKATVLGLVVAFIARPLSAAMATAFEPQFGGRDRVLLGWAGLRGAVPVVLAALPVIENIHRSLEFFNIVFFTVLVSTLIQGSTVGMLARRLKLSIDAAEGDTAEQATA